MACRALLISRCLTSRGLTPWGNKVLARVQGQDASNGATRKRIRIQQSDGTVHRYELNNQREFQALLDGYRCGGGLLQAAGPDASGFGALNFEQVEDDRVYQVVGGPQPSKHSSVRNVTLVPPQRTDFEPGHAITFKELTQEDLAALLNLHGGAGVVPEGGKPYSEALRQVRLLQDNGTYHIVDLGTAPTWKLQMENLKSSDQRRLQGHEWASQATLEGIAKQLHGTTAEYTALTQKKYADKKGNVLVELDGAVIVKGNNVAQGYDLYVCDHKQTASDAAVYDITQRVQYNIKKAMQVCPQLAQELANVRRVHAFMVVDTCAGDDPQSWDEVTRLATENGVHIVRRSGSEYACQACTSLQGPAATLLVPHYDLARGVLVASEVTVNA